MGSTTRNCPTCRDRVTSVNGVPLPENDSEHRNPRVDNVDDQFNVMRAQTILINMASHASDSENEIRASLSFINQFCPAIIDPATGNEITSNIAEVNAHNIAEVTAQQARIFLNARLDALDAASLRGRASQAVSEEEIRGVLRFINIFCPAGIDPATGNEMPFNILEVTAQQARVLLAARLAQLDADYAAGQAAILAAPRFAAPEAEDAGTLSGRISSAIASAAASVSGNVSSMISAMTATTIGTVSGGIVAGSEQLFGRPQIVASPDAIIFSGVDANGDEVYVNNNSEVVRPAGALLASIQAQDGAFTVNAKEEVVNAQGQRVNLAGEVVEDKKIFNLAGRVAAFASNYRNSLVVGTGAAALIAGAYMYPEAVSAADVEAAMEYVNPMNYLA